MYDTLEVDLFLEHQTKEIQKCQQQQKELERMIQYHHNIKTYRTIPRRFKPSNIPTTAKPNSTLTDDFNGKFERLFFDHLRQSHWSGHHNTRTDEIEEGQHHGTDGDIHEHTTNDTTGTIWRIPTIPDYKQNNRPHTPPSATNQTNLFRNHPQNQTTTKSTTMLGKRQRKEEHPSCSKHFLWQGPHPSLQPPWLYIT